MFPSPSVTPSAAPAQTSAVVPQSTSQPLVLHRSIVKSVLSGDSVIIRGQPRNGPPPEKQINLTNITAPKLARRPADGLTVDSHDEV